MRRWLIVAALILGIGVVFPEAQGRFWVLVNGALQYTGVVQVNGPQTVTGNLILGSASDVYLYRSAAKTLKVDTNGAGGALTLISLIGPVTTSTTLTVGTTGTATVLAGSYSLALTTAQPADQTGNATSTLKMNGLGAAAAPCTITPTSTGRVWFSVDGDLTNSTILDGISYKLVYGTGGAPANAGTAAGTAISALRGPAVPVAAQKQGFSVQGSATALALATAVWFDLQVANVTGGTASISNVTCNAHEI